MSRPQHTALSRRERQIMDILYRLGRAAAGDVMAELPGDPSYSTVRTQLRVLEEKGHVRHEEQGLRYVYVPAVPRHAARKSALRHVVDTFFDGSAEKTVAALLGGENARLSDEELDRIVRSDRESEKGKLAMNLLLESTLKVSLIVLFALASTVLLRKRSAAMRHWMLSAAIACAAVAPMLEPFAPGWNVQLNVPSALDSQAPLQAPASGSTAGQEGTSAPAREAESSSSPSVGSGA